MTFDIDAVRTRFPALAIADAARPRVYLDNPAGTQVPRDVVDRTTACLVEANANLGGHFATTVAAGRIVDEARAAMADFLGASGPDEIVFGQNMTTLTFHVSRSIGRMLSPGDEIVVTRMDHDANIAPWLMLAEERGLAVRWLDVDPRTCEFDLSELDGVLSERTRLVAVGLASNLTGTVNDVRAIAARARDAGALVYVDAVQFAPHGLIDVANLGADFLVCSAYKVYGPHQGILWGRRDLLEQLTAYKVRPAGERAPDKFETGTLSHEGLAGTLGAIEYLASLGAGAEDGRRARIASAFARISGHENALCRRLIDGLGTIPGVIIHGITNPDRMNARVPTVSFTCRGHRPRAIARALAIDNIFVWDGHNYALELVRRLGLEEGGGVVRIGLAHYNTAAEIDQAVDAVARAASRADSLH